MLRPQQRPQQNPIVSKLLKTGLFSKIGTNFRSSNLKLIGTNYYVIIGGTPVKPIYDWYFIPPGSMPMDECSFFTHTPKRLGVAEAMTKENTARRVSLEEVFESIPSLLQEKIMYHLNILPK